MKVNSIQHNDNKCCLSITFSNEIEERIFLKNILNWFEKVLPVNCMLTDLDTSYSIYEQYFRRNNYYVFDRLTTASIFAFDLTSSEIQEVISNWGYFTIDAIFAIGTIDDEVKKKKLDNTHIFKSLPAVITQVLDYSVDITIEQRYFKNLLQFIEV
ncbi:MAG: hypothetical protein E7614_08900 [Ruminococcaceae bacterium]|nr:hypothetical protein [Oscillospiraceae bacterium]